MKFPTFYWIQQRSLLISQQTHSKIPVLSSIYYNIIFNYQNQSKFGYYLFIFFYLFSNIENKHYKIIAKWFNKLKIYLFQFIIKLKSFCYFLSFLYFSSIASSLNSYVCLHMVKSYKNINILQLPMFYVNNFILLNCIFSKNILIYKQIQLFQFTLLIKAIIFKRYYLLELLLRWFLKLSVLLYVPFN